MATARRRSHVHHHRRGTSRRYAEHRKGGRTTLLALLAVMGPGLLAGLSDDDPAGITTYSLMGAQYGYGLLWAVLVSGVILVVFHLLGMRLGMATGQGFAAVVRSRYGARTAWTFTSVLVVANLGTLCAEYAGVSAAAPLLGLPARPAVAVTAVVVVLLLVRCSFSVAERVLVAVSCLLVLFVPSALLAGPDWHQALLGTVVPDHLGDKGAVEAVAACLGTTLAPWGLAFIQSYAVDKGLTLKEYALERVDVIFGSVLTVVIGAFIIVGCAATLHTHHTVVHEARDIAMALRPIAGDQAFTLFAVGLLGAAVLAAAAVALATSYSIGEADGHEPRIDEGPRQEKLFYGALAGLTVVAAALVSLPGIDLVQLIYLSQVLNAVLLLPQIVALALLTRDPKVMGKTGVASRVQTWSAWVGIVLVAGSIAALASTTFLA